MALRRSVRRLGSAALATALLATGGFAAMTAVAPGAFAAGTSLFNQPFHDNTVDGTGAVTVISGTTSSCLTASGNATANPLASCSTANDAQGSGTLRLTPATATQKGAVFASASVPTSQGLDVQFTSYQYGGNGADGLGFALAAVDPTNPVAPALIGVSGGGLGYTAKGAASGLTDGYLGIGFDAYGNYSNNAYEGTGCTDPSYIATPSTTPNRVIGQVVVRGPGNGTVGYCAINSTATSITASALALRATTRTAVPVEVVINSTASATTNSHGTTVPAGRYDVSFTPVGGSLRDLNGPLPAVANGLYPSSWLNSGGIPRQLAFGWDASTGSSYDYHEIDKASIASINPVPVLAVAQTSYVASTVTTGTPVSYVATATSSGATETSPVTITETLPQNVNAVSAYGTGWTCGAPTGRQISCTSSANPFTSGTITVNGVIAANTVTPAQAATGAVVAFSADASAGFASTSTSGTLPTAPTITVVAPTAGGSVGGNDVTISGTNLSGASAVEIGTAAQISAGTATTLSPCATGTTTGCFTVTSSTALDIPSMPAHAVGAVTVQVVTLGETATGSYTYNAGPVLAFAAPPSGEVGAAYSDQLTETGGSGPFVWAVSSGLLPAGVSLGAATGLLSGTPTAAGTSSFTVRVTDASSLSATQSTSISVVAGPALTFPAPPNGEINTAYSAPSSATGGTSPYTWSTTSTLPTGITLNTSTGLLSGTPTSTGNYSIALVVTDARSQTDTKTRTVTVIAGPAVTSGAPASAVVGTAYTTTFVASGGTIPYTWSSTGTLPVGLTLDPATGILSGTPTSVGTSAFTVTATDANGQPASANVSLTVASVLTLTLPTPVSGEVGVAYAETFTAAQGTGPYTYAVSSGSTLPGGLSLGTSTGVLSGTPTTAGTPGFSITATDAAGQTATLATSVAIVAAPTLTFTTMPAGQLRTAYSDALTESGGTPPYTWSVSVGSLPAGLTLDPSTGVVSGTPTALGSTSFTIRLVDTNGRSATQPVTLVVGSASATVGLSSSAASVTFGTTVTLTASLTPTSATGTVSFTEIPSSGSHTGTTVALGTGTISAGVATLSVALPAFGANAVTASYGGDGTFGTATSSTSVEIHAYTGEVIVREFRTSGPAGDKDGYVELYNTGVTIPLAGFTVTTTAGTATVSSSAGTLGTGRSYLLAASNYSLGGVAVRDQSTATLGDAGVQITAPDTAGTRTDAVGPGGSYHLGTGLGSMSGSPTNEYAWVRRESGLTPVNSGSNAADFKLVSTTGGTVGGVQSTLGSPAPIGSTTAYQQDTVLRSSLLDPSKSGAAGPNFSWVPATGLLTVRRTITNTSGLPITGAEIRIVALSEANGLPRAGGQPSNPAALRLVDPLTPTSVFTVGGLPVVVQNLSVNSPATAAAGGGLNTTLSLNGGLAVGATVSIAVTFKVDQRGVWWFIYDVDATAGSGGPALIHSVPARSTVGRRSGDAGGSGVLR